MSFDKSVFILAGGLGTRLRSVQPDLPKVMSLFHGKPFLSFLLDRVVELGAKETTLCVGYKAESIEEKFGREYRGMKLNYSREEELLGTAGAVRLALPFCKHDHALIFNGDSYFDINLKKFNDWYDMHQSDIGMALASVEDVSRFGSVRLEGEKVVGFAEKDGDFGGGLINAGIYLLKKSLLEKIPFDRAVSFEKEMFPLWLAMNFMGFAWKGAFLDIGTPESYRQAEKFLQAYA